MLEREIKLRFGSAREAREAVLALGASMVRERRFQDDALFDDANLHTATDALAL